MTYKKPDLAALQAECDAFNASCKVGGRVAVNLYGGSDKPIITTTRTEAQILSGHTAVVWMDGVSGCWSLGHVTPISETTTPADTAPKAGEATLRNWLTRIHDNELSIGDRLQGLSSRISSALSGEPEGKYPPYVIREQAIEDEWSAAPPTEQGWYWHWNGDPDHAPFVLSILYSGSALKCFVSMNQTHSGQAEMCDAYGGYWMRLRAPATPDPSTIKGLAK